MTLRRTQLHPWHVKHARMFEFAGYEMPLWYTGAVDEHMAVRLRAGVFDVSHMGRIMLSGRDAEKLLDRLIPTTMSKAEPGRAFYTLMCNEVGGVLDDLVVLTVKRGSYLLVVNAANRFKVLEHARKHSTGLCVEVVDLTDSSAMLSLQGPYALEVAEDVLGVGLSGVGRWRFRVVEEGLIASRTGYTGEDGFELILLDCVGEGCDKVFKLWERLLSHRAGVKACGLAARDTLRLEAGLCLYGSELREDITPLEAGLGWLVSFEKDFVGAEALRRQAEEGVRMVRVGLLAEERCVPRHGYKVFYEGGEVGWVSSGTLSPLLKRGVAMAYVKPEYGGEGERLDVDIRGRLYRFMVVKPPFYDTNVYGWSGGKERNTVHRGY